MPVFSRLNHESYCELSNDLGYEATVHGPIRSWPRYCEGLLDKMPIVRPGKAQRTWAPRGIGDPHRGEETAITSGGGY